MDLVGSRSRLGKSRNERKGKRSLRKKGNVNRGGREKTNVKAESEDPSLGGDGKMTQWDKGESQYHGKEIPEGLEKGGVSNYLTK